MKKQKNIKLKKLLSIMALLEVLILIIAVTYSWTMDSKTQSKLYGNEFEVILGGDIYATQDGMQINSISNSNITLAETSSVDGRNFFFPLENNITNVTKDMIFREGTPADVNVNYFQCDFELTALKDNVNVYLEVNLTADDAVKEPIRISINRNNGETPIVMSNTAGTFNPIKSIKVNGKPETSENNTVKFTKHSATPILTFENNGDVENITVTIWLEGTEITSDDIANHMLDAELKFFTA